MSKRSSIDACDSSVICLLDVGLHALERIVEYVNDPLSLLDLGTLSTSWHAKMRLLQPSADLRQRVQWFRQRSASVHHVRTGRYFAVKAAARRGELRSVKWFLAALRDNADAPSAAHNGWQLGVGSDSLLCDLFELACRHGHVDVAHFLCTVTSESALRTLLSKTVAFADHTMISQPISLRFAIKCSPHESTVGSWLDATFGSLQFSRCAFLSALDANNFFARALCAVGRCDASLLLTSDGALQPNIKYDDDDVPCYENADEGWHDVFFQCAINGCVDIARLLLPKMQEARSESFVWFVDVLSLSIACGQLAFANWLCDVLPETREVFGDMRHVRAFFGPVCCAPAESAMRMFDFVFGRLQQAQKVALMDYFGLFLQHAAIHCNVATLQHMMRRIGLAFDHVLSRPARFLQLDDNVCFANDVFLGDAMFLSACYGSNTDVAAWLYDLRKLSLCHMIVSRASNINVDLCWANQRFFEHIVYDFFDATAWHTFYGFMVANDEFECNGEHVSEMHLRFLEWHRCCFDIVEAQTLPRIPPLLGRLDVSNRFTARTLDWANQHALLQLADWRREGAIRRLCHHNRVHELQYIHSKFKLQLQDLHMDTPLYHKSMDVRRWAEAQWGVVL